MLELENKYLRVSISTKGAELQSIYHKELELEYLWGADPTFWGKKSPVLFPIVGGLKDNTYHYNGTSYQMSRHGFARDMEFKVVAQSNGSISLQLKANEASLKQYPFLFSFTITYSLEKNCLSCNYQVSNVDIKPMFFSVGAHPAFKVPLVEGTSFEDYYLLFEKNETAGQWPLTPDGLIKSAPIPFFHTNNRIDLSKPLFYGDALVFKDLQSNSISLITDKSKHGFKFNYHRFPFMGIWSTKDADFVCIEPWCGIADNENTTGELKQKEGINLLVPGELISRTWSVELF